MEEDEALILEVKKYRVLYDKTYPYLNIRKNFRKSMRGEPLTTHLAKKKVISLSLICVHEVKT